MCFVFAGLYHKLMPCSVCRFPQMRSPLCIRAVLDFQKLTEAIENVK